MKPDHRILADQFVADYGRRYGFPELTQVKLRWGTPDDENIEATIQVQPLGQISALVRELSIAFTIEFEKETGRLIAYVKLSYQHHSGGSNGNSTAYLIVYEENVLQKQPIYYGFIPNDLLYRKQMQEETHKRRLERTKTS